MTPREPSTNRRQDALGLAQFPQFIMLILSGTSYEMPILQESEHNQERQEKDQVWFQAALSLQGVQERVR
jgi:hypothetical protein